MTTATQSAPAGLLDLESELTCSICTDILYQPLTLLDCLHTFCGGCLKEWFGWQQVRQDQEAERSHGRARQYDFTCPSCRTTVRDTRPNATVTTLLEMYIQANPTRAKTQVDRDEILKTYKHGDPVLPVPEPAERRRRRDMRRIQREDHQDAQEVEYNRMMEHAMAMSMDEALGDSSSQRLNRAPNQRGEAVNGQYDVRRQRRHEEPGDHDRSVQDMHEFDERPGNSHGVTTLRRNATAARSLRLGHQSSLRSLLSSSEIDSDAMQQEIMRQIQEEGLLDGIDLENIQVEQEDEISERIAQAYRRRQRIRTRHARDRSRGSSSPATQTAGGTTSSREPTSRQTTTIPTTQSTEHARPAQRSGHLSPPADNHHRRTASHEESRDGRTRARSNEIRPASRSATDLTNRPRSREAEARARRTSGQHRRSTEPHQPLPSEQWRRAAVDVPPHTRAEAAVSSPIEDARSSNEEAPIPAQNLTVDGTVEQARSASVAAPRIREDIPRLFCNRCRKENIAFELHHNCSRCAETQQCDSFNLCDRCYMTGQGCLNWYGFSAAAIDRFHRQGKSLDSCDPPHFPSSRTFTPPNTLQEGVFCSICHRLANDCFWHCQTCNEGDWGYCNSCLTQARHCTHSLTPYAWEPETARSLSPFDLKTTALAPLNDMIPYCDICHLAITPSPNSPVEYVHCPTCNKGDYDICLPCYIKCAQRQRITESNGLYGWRRCLAGHRMLLIRLGIQFPPIRRQVVADVIGGWALDDASAQEQGNGQWSWREAERSEVRTKENHVARAHAQSHRNNGSDASAEAPPSGGYGGRAVALWTRIPDEGVTDELTFPKGAEITEVANINEDWSFGVYCRQKGLFPAPYVGAVKESSQARNGSSRAGM